MRVPSRRELERLFDDPDLADEAHFLEVGTSWPSLRVLDHLHAADGATTGDVARALNMDMTEVRDRLEALERAEVVVRDGDEWRPATDRIEVDLVGRDDGLDVRHALVDAPETEPGDAVEPGPGDVPEPESGDEPGRDDDAPDGPFTRLGRRLDELLPW